MMDVKVVRMNTGEDIIFNLLEDNEKFLKIENVLVAGPSATGSIGFGPWAPLVKDGDPIELNVDYICYIADPQIEVAENYQKIFSKIETPSKKLIL
tara:strand:- start:1135 stop:1422 length:288 start_codon:yes stop_codon:yes gene_type:complete